MQINEDKKNSVLMDLTMAKMLIDKAIKETNSSYFCQSRYNEYLKIARKIILDNYFDWAEYYKEN